jgi:hypothetical protein
MQITKRKTADCTCIYAVLGTIPLPIFLIVYKIDSVNALSPLQFSPRGRGARPSVCYGRIIFPRGGNSSWHVLNVHMIGKNLANTTTSLEDKNIIFFLKHKIEKINV